MTADTDDMRRTLAPGEQTIISTRPQARSLVWPAMLFVLASALCGYLAALLHRGLGKVAPALVGYEDELALAVVLIAAVGVGTFCLRRLLGWAATRYLLTSRRLVSRRGLLRRYEQQFPLVAVQNLGTRQSVLQRLLRSGNVVVDLGPEGGAVFKDVPEVERFRAFALDAIEELPRTAMFDGQSGWPEEEMHSERR